MAFEEFLTPYLNTPNLQSAWFLLLVLLVFPPLTMWWIYCTVPPAARRVVDTVLLILGTPYALMLSSMFLAFDVSEGAGGGALGLCFMTAVLCGSMDLLHHGWPARGWGGFGILISCIGVKGTIVGAVSDIDRWTR